MKTTVHFLKDSAFNLHKKTIPVASARIYFLVLILVTFVTVSRGQVTQTYNASTTWTCPIGVNSVTVQCWGGGGAGGGNTSTSNGGGGGGGGAYASSTIAVIPGTVYTVNVGTGGTASTGNGGAGNDTWFVNNSTVMAKGGAGGIRGSVGAGSGGLGGSDIASSGTTKLIGGNGGIGRSNTTGQGGPGGSSAGTALGGTNGNNPWTTTLALAAPAGGGMGGNGGSSGNNGSPGVAPGGGGGGAGDVTFTNRTGGAGANGRVVLTYTPLTYKSQLVSMDLGSSTWCPGETRNVTIQIMNIGTATWTDGSGGTPVIKIGAKWNTNGANWADYYIQVSAGTVAPGATAAYVIPVTASNNTGSGYTTPLANGANNLTFDVKYESVGWFGSNTGGLGPGNTTFVSPVQNIGVADKVVTAVPTAMCSGNSGNIKVAASLANTTYQLRNNADNSLIGVPVTGTGGDILLPTGILTSTTTFNVLATLIAEGCSAQMSNTPTISVGTAPGMPGSISGTLNQCSGVSGQIYSIATVPGATSYTWSVPAGWTINGGQGTVSISVTTGANSGNIAVFAANPCGSGTSNSITVNVTPSPTVSNAGSNQIICVTATTSVVLAANIPVTGTGVWSIVSGPSTLLSQFSSTANPAATFTRAGGLGTYVLRWTITNGSCISYSDVSIVFNSTPTTPNISFQQFSQSSSQTITVCTDIGGGGQDDIDIYNYSPPSGSSWQWQYSSNGSPWTFAAVPLNTAQYVIGNFAGIVGVHQFRMVLTTSGGCVVYSNIVTLTVKPTSTTNIGGATINSCSGAPFSSAITGFPVGTTFTWTAPVVTGGMTGGAAGNSGSGTTISGTLVNNTSSPQTAVYTVTPSYNPGCPVTFSFVVTVAAYPTINASSTATAVCSSSSAQTTTLSYGALVSSPTTYSISWDPNPPNSFAPVINAALVPSPIVINIPANTNAGTYIGYISNSNASGCIGNANPFLLTVYSSTTTITNQPVAPAPTCPGSGVQTISVTATGSGLTYSWRKDGVPVTNGGVYSGQGTAALTLTNATNAETGNYDVIISSICALPVTSNTVTVSLKAKPVISAQPVAPAEICSGSGVQTIGVIASGNGLIYTWRKGGVAVVNDAVISGQGTPTLTLTNPGVTYAGNYDVIISGDCTPSVISDAVAVSIKAPGMWLGINTNWNNPANWCGGIPNSTTDVYIPVTGSGFYPVLNFSTGSARDITIAAGASLEVHQSVLKVAGNISNNSGIFDIHEGKLELNGTGPAQNISGSLFMNNKLMDLLISNSSGVNLAGINDTLKLTGTVKFGVSGSALYTNGNLTLVSDNEGTASIGDMTNNGTNSGNNIIGNVTVERYIPNHFKAWQFLAVPTSGQTIRDAWQEGNTPLSNAINPGYGTIITSNISGAVSLGFDVYTPAGPSMKTFDAIANSWVGVAGTSIPIANKKGYMLMVRGDRSVTAFNQPATKTILRTTGKLYTIGADAPPSTSVNAGSFESVGNPYASAIDFDKVTKTGGVQDIFYVWDPKLTSNLYSAWGLGAYQTIIGPGPNYTVVPGGGSYAGGNTNIESGQAFLVYAPFTPGTVSFTETSKTDGSNIVTRPFNNAVKQFRTNLYGLLDNNPVLLDGNMVQFDNAYYNDIDLMDARKLSNSSENLGISRNGQKLVMERRAEVQSGDTIYFDLGQVRVKQYQFEFIPELLNEPGLVAYLVDNYLQSSTPVSLVDTTRVIFNIINEPGSYDPGRFKVIFKRTAPVPVKITQIKAIRNTDNKVTVKWEVESETGILRYELQHSTDGQAFRDILEVQPVANNEGRASYSEVDSKALLQDNFYRVKAISASGLIQYSSMVKVGPVKTNGSITIFPNPVTNHEMQLQCNHMPTGEYLVRVINNIGQRIFETKILINSNNELKIIKLDKFINSGNYQLSLIGPDGNSSIIQLLVR